MPTDKEIEAAGDAAIKLMQETLEPVVYDMFCLVFKEFGQIASVYEGQRKFIKAALEAAEKARGEVTPPKKEEQTHDS